MRLLTFFIGFVCWMAACSPSGKQTPSNQPVVTDSIQYARGFTIQHFDDYTKVEVRDPWDTTRLLQRYLLIDRNETAPAALPKGTIVRIPVDRVVVYTSVHASIIDQLGELSRIIGVCEPRYMDTPGIQEGLKEGRIFDLGEATSPNVEQMIECEAEVVIASPFQNSSYGPVEKLGIPIIEGADYMESLPLGRTEWLKFYGLLFDKEAVADSIFRQTEQRYLALKELAAHVEHRPTVFTEKKFGASWFVPGGQSNIGNLLNDAGADYIFKDIPGSASQPLAFETVLDKAIHAEYWLMKYNQKENLTYKALETEYSPYHNFDAFKQRNIYGCNTGYAPYYEEFPLHPDYLLKNMIWIFHPELLPGYEPRYYQRISE